MPTVDYVAQYVRLEEKASRAEAKAEEYAERGDEYRWEQCRIALEATTPPDVRGTPRAFSQRAFAGEVGVNQSTISRQAACWVRWGDDAPGHHPSYADAMNEIRPDRGSGNRTQEMADEGLRHASDDALGEELRARNYTPITDDDIDDVVESVRRGASRAVGMESDASAEWLRRAAVDLTRALTSKERHGVDFPEEDARLLDRVKHCLSAYESGTTRDFTDDDRAFLAELGVEL